MYTHVYNVLITNVSMHMRKRGEKITHRESDHWSERGKRSMH